MNYWLYIKKMEVVYTEAIKYFAKYSNIWIASYETVHRRGVSHPSVVFAVNGKNHEFVGDFTSQEIGSYLVKQHYESIMKALIHAINMPQLYYVITIHNEKLQIYLGSYPVKELSLPSNEKEIYHAILDTLGAADE